MSLIATVSNTDTGHDGYPPRPIIAGESGYTIHGLDIATVGSPLDFHNYPKGVNHNATVASGNPNYTINGKPIARIGDSISCGGSLTTGQADYDIP